MATMPMFSASERQSSSSLSVLPKISSQGNLIAGSVARVGVGLVLNPFTLLKARFEVCEYQRYSKTRLSLTRSIQSNFYAHHSIWYSLRDVIKTYGSRGLLQGFGASALRDAPYSGIFVLSYELMKQQACESVGFLKTISFSLTHLSALFPLLHGAPALALSGEYVEPTK